MTNMKKKLAVKFHWRRLLQFFLQGLVVIAPIGVTIYAVYFLFTTVDGILPNIVQRYKNLLPKLGNIDTIYLSVVSTSRLLPSPSKLFANARRLISTPNYQIPGPKSLKIVT